MSQSSNCPTVPSGRESRLYRGDVLAGRVCLITGGGTGIGAAAARELARMGGRVIIASRKASHIEPAAAGLSEELGVPVAGRILDIRDREACDALCRAIVAEFGSLDVLVNNGGGQFLAPAETIRQKGWEAVISTNLTGTWNMTRASADAWMLEHGGRIIQITMLTGRGFPGMAHSSAARAGVEGMTRTLAVEWARRGIRINSLQPGIVNSSGLRNYPDGTGLARQLQAEIPVPRLGNCEELAWMIGFLAGPGGDYITGQVLTVDGGRSLWGNTWPLQFEGELPEVQVPVEPWERGGEGA